MNDENNADQNERSRVREGSKKLVKDKLNNAKNNLAKKALRKAGVPLSKEDLKKELAKEAAKKIVAIVGIKVIAITIAIILVLILIIALVSYFSGSGSPVDDFYDYVRGDTEETPPDGTITYIPIPGLKLILDQPAPATPGEPITLVINVEDTQNEDIEVLASIPQGYRFSAATGAHALNGDLVTWKLSQNAPEPSSDDIMKKYRFTLTIIANPEATDVPEYTVSARYTTAQNAY